MSQNFNSNRIDIDDNHRNSIPLTPNADGASNNNSNITYAPYNFLNDQLGFSELNSAEYSGNTLNVGDSTLLKSYIPPITKNTIRDKFYECIYNTLNSTKKLDNISSSS